MLQVDRHFFVADRVILRAGHLFYDVAAQGERFGDCKASAVALNGVHKNIGLVVDLKHSAFQRGASREAIDGIVICGLLPNLNLGCDGSVLPLNLCGRTISDVDSLQLVIHQVSFIVQLTDISCQVFRHVA